MTDRKILATSRLKARFEVFAGRVLLDDIARQINKALPMR